MGELDRDNVQWRVSEFFEPEKLKITEWAEDDRPREKLMANGAETLSNAELLAILIGNGSRKETAVDLMKKVMRNCSDSLKVLGRMSIDELMTYHGIGEAKAVTILAACELGKRRENEAVLQRTDMSSSQLIYEYMLPKMQDLDTEEAWVLLLNNNFKLIKPVRLSHGGLTETSVDVRVIMKEAVMVNATIIVLLHNHPSGNVKPSRDDDGLTKRVEDACRTMRMHLADHIIVTDGDYYSYRDNGKL